VQHANTRLSASGGTLAGDLIITGNLTVSGNSTTLNAEILTIEDADIVLLSNVASTPALNAGIIVNRGTSTNTFLRWDEVTDKWGWSDDGSTTYKFTSALDAYAQANSAYGAANNRVLKAGDTMTGQLNISAGGLLVTGNVGIGTASPSAKLHILTGSNKNILFKDASHTTLTTDLGSAITFSRPSDGSNDLSGIFSWNNGGLVLSSRNEMIFATGGTSSYSNSIETMRITRNDAGPGNVGIGTTSPATTLHVDASGGGIVRVSRLGTGAGILQLEADGTDGTVTTTNTMKFVTNGSERMRLDTSGNLFLNAFSGRGGGSTGYLFKLNPGKVYLELMANNTTSTSDILFTDGAAGAYGIVGYDHSNDSLRIYTNSSWQMTVNSSGYLGIGNTAPPRRLTVQSLGTGNYEMVVGWAAQSLSQNATMDVICTHDNLAFQVWDDNNYTTPRFVVERGGDVGIGTTNPTQKLDVVGNIKASGTMAANGTIDVAGDGGAGYVGSRIVLRTHNNYRGAGIFLVGETSAVSNNTFYIGTPYSDHSGGLYFRHTANNYQTDYQSAAFTSAGNTIMYMSPGGSVGIGTNSPSSKLHVVGNILANGCPVQVQYTSSGTRTTVDSTSFVEPSTSYRVAITPKSTSSMIRLRFFIPANAYGASNTIYTVRLFRIIGGSTSYSLTSAGSSNGSRNVIAGSTFRPPGYDNNDPMPMIIDAVDFPNTTSTCTYGFEFKRETGGAGTVYFGYTQGDNSNWGFDADIVIIAEEIGQ